MCCAGGLMRVAVFATSASISYIQSSPTQLQSGINLQNYSENTNNLKANKYNKNSVKSTFGETEWGVEKAPQ